MQAINYNNIFILSIYIIILFGISFWANRHNKDHSKFLLGGRSLGPTATAVSAGASDMSGWLLLGLPGAIYISGLNQSWIAIGLVIGTCLNWYLIAKRLRIKSELTHSITIPEFLSNTVANSKALRIIAGIIIIVFFTVYVASGFVAGAKTFSDYFGINYYWGLLLTFGLVTLCTMIGGFLSVSWTEFFQGMIMVSVIVVVPLTILFNMHHHNISFVTNLLKHNDNALNLFHNTSALGIISLLSWGLGYFGQPHILSKFMAIREPENINYSRRVAILWIFLGLGFAVFIGLIGASYFGSIKLQDPELVMLELAKATLHPLFIGIIIIAIISAVFSTANAQLLIVSSVFTNDLQILNKSVITNRVMVCVVGIIAAILASNENSKVLSLVSYAWAGFGASFGPLILMCLYSKKGVSNLAAISGMVIGGLTVIIWILLRFIYPEVQLLQLYELLPAFVISLLTIMLLNIKKPN